MPNAAEEPPTPLGVVQPFKISVEFVTNSAEADRALMALFREWWDHELDEGVATTEGWLFGDPHPETHPMSHDKELAMPPSTTTPVGRKNFRPVDLHAVSVHALTVKLFSIDLFPSVQPPVMVSLPTGARAPHPEPIMTSLDTVLKSLSSGALITLDALIANTFNCTGGEFGFMDETLAALRSDHGMTRHQFAGFVSHLSNLGLVESEDLSLASGIECDAIQFNMSYDLDGREDEIAAAAKGLTLDPLESAPVVNVTELPAVQGTAGLIIVALTIAAKNGKPAATMTKISNLLGIPVQTVRAAMLYGKNADRFVQAGKDGRSKLWTLA